MPSLNQEDDMKRGDGSARQLEAAKRNAIDLAKLLRRQARRPFVLEITGTPKAGKTTLISLVDGFLRDAGWRMHVLKERAGACPLPMKGHFLFNTWTTGTMLAALIDAVDRDDDLVILDRGVFDALIWLEIQKRQGQVSNDEARAFRDFVMIDRWRSLTDATCTIEVDAAVSMRRENEHRLLPRTGSVMNAKTLPQFNTALAALKKRHANDFSFVELSNGGTANDGAIQLVDRILQLTRDWADPEIAVISREVARELIPDRVQDWTAQLWRKVSRHVVYRKRSSVETDEDWVQVLACGAQVFNKEVFLSIRRRQRAQLPSERDNSARVWQGCHIHRAARLDVAELNRQLLARLKADLHLGELASNPRPLGIVWTPSDSEPGHLGIFFKVPIEQRVATFLDEKEFRTNGRGHRRESSFVAPHELSPGNLQAKGYTVEQWSLEVLKAKWLP
jgi:predicted ATPase